MPSVVRLYDTFQPQHYRVTFDLRAARERIFKGTVTITGTQLGTSIIPLHAADLEVSSVKVNDTDVPYTHVDDELHISYDAPGEVTVDIEFAGNITDQMHGIYPCYFTVDGAKRELYATQFESHHAREAFPCVDEPEAKATYDITLIGETGQTMLSNMPETSRDTAGGIDTVTFATTPRMSSYLLAFVVGELQHASATTASGVDVNVYATRAHDARTLEFALTEATRTIEFFDEYFGVPYPLPKADHVALPDFSSGAMENWGLITYRESALLADPRTSTIDSKRYISTVIAHELSHQWFGNLVTMKWWNDLWLNESFASIMEFLPPDAAHPDWDMWLDFSTNDAVAALRRDAIDGVQPVQVDVAHPDEITSLFDGAIVYAKGARLMNMMRNYVGDDAFRRGLSAYFDRHKYGNTTADDLWLALSHASGKDVGAFMTAWISQPGYPVVSVSRQDGQLTLMQRQFYVGPHTDSSRVWPIPLRASTDSLPELFDQPRMTVACSDPIVQLNTDNTGHYLVQYDDDLLTSLLDGVRKGELDVTQRIKFLHEQLMLARGEAISTATLIDILLAYRDETHESVWQIMNAAVNELKKFTLTDAALEAKLKQLVGDLSRTRYDALGWEELKDESINDTKLRASILGNMIYSEDSDAIAEAIRRARATTYDQLDPELRVTLLSADVRHGDNPQLVDDLIAAYRDTSDPELKSDLRSALVATKDSAVITKLIGLLTDTDTIRLQDNTFWFVYLLSNREGREPTWQWLRDNWQWLVDKFGSDKSFDYYPRYAGQVLTTRQHLADYRAFFTPMLGDPALTRTIEMGMIDLEGRVELLERQQAAVASRLHQL